jgi:phage shock protein A
MSVIGRIKRVTAAKVEVLLSRVEDPEALFPQLVREMEEQVRVLIGAEAKAIAARAASERDLRQSESRCSDMSKGAEASLKAGDEALAREALAAVLRLEDECERRRGEVAAVSAASDSATQAREDAEAALDELRAKKDEMLSRARVVRARENIERTVRGPASSGSGLLDAVSRMEASVNEREAALDVRNGLGVAPGEASLKRRIDAQNMSAEIEHRLALLKENLHAEAR